MFRGILFRLVLTSLLIWAGSATPFAADLPAAFDSANKLYEQGRFPEAASAYETILQSGHVSPALYFNLGNALFKGGDIGRAVAAYRHAGRLVPRDPDLQANLQFVRNQIQGPTLPPDPWQRWLRRLTLNEWTVLASAGLWVFLLLLALCQLRPALKPSLRTPALLAGAVTVVLCACLGASIVTDSTPTAVVIVHDAAVRTGPLDESQSAFTAYDGAELAVLDHKEGWLQVSAGDRRSGWLKREQVSVWP
jgi:tetratricopeptide (TPR) repeat protein